MFVHTAHDIFENSHKPHLNPNTFDVYYSAGTLHRAMMRLVPAAAAAEEEEEVEKEQVEGGGGVCGGATATAMIVDPPLADSTITVERQVRLVVPHR
jgi:hypothetical protein